MTFENYRSVMASHLMSAGRARTQLMQRLIRESAERGASPSNDWNKVQEALFRSNEVTTQLQKEIFSSTLDLYL